MSSAAATLETIEFALHELEKISELIAEIAPGSVGGVARISSIVLRGADGVVREISAQQLRDAAASRALGQAAGQAAHDAAARAGH